MTALHPSGSEGPRTPCRSCGRSGPRHGAGGGGGFLEGLWDGVRGWCCKGPPETGGRKDGVLQSLPPQAGSRLSSQALELPGWLGPRTGPAQRPGATHAVSAAGGEQLWSLPAVPHAGLGVPAQPPPEPAARGHEVHRWVLPAQGPLSARALGSAPGGAPWPRQPGSGLPASSPRPVASRHLPPPSHAGAMLQDYFTDICLCLKKGDVAVLRKREWGPGGSGLPLSPAKAVPSPPGLRRRIQLPQAGAGRGLPQVLPQLPGGRGEAVPVRCGLLSPPPEGLAVWCRWLSPH